MNTHEYIRKAEAFKLIREYMEKVPLLHLACIKVSPVRISEIWTIRANSKRNRRKDKNGDSK